MESDNRCLDMWLSFFLSMCMCKGSLLWISTSNGALVSGCVVTEFFFLEQTTCRHEMRMLTMKWREYVFTMESLCINDIDSLSGAM